MPAAASVLERFTLSNGLRVVLSPDPSAPVIGAPVGVVMPALELILDPLSLRSVCRCDMAGPIPSFKARRSVGRSLEDRRLLCGYPGESRSPAGQNRLYTPTRVPVPSNAGQPGC